MLQEKKKYILACFVIFLVALAIRISYFFESTSFEIFSTLVIDADDYHEKALYLLENWQFNKEFFWHHFSYPVILAFIYLIFGPSIVAAKVIQAILGAINCVLLFKIGDRLFNRRIALLAAVMLAFYAPLIFFENRLLPTSWEVFGLLALILVSIKDKGFKSYSYAVAQGVFSAFLVVTRSTFLPFIFFNLVYLAMKKWSYKHSRLAWLKLQLACLVPCFGILLAVSLINYKVNNDFNFTPIERGINLYIGNNPDYCRTVNTRPGPSWLTLINEPKRESGINEFKNTSPFYVDKVKSFILNSPQKYFEVLIMKAKRIFHGYEIARNVDMYIFRDQSMLLNTLLHARGLYFPLGLILPFALLFLLFRFRQTPFILRAFSFIWILVLLGIFITSRYRVPWAPILCLLAAAGMFFTWETIKSRNIKKITLVTLALISLIYISNYKANFCEMQINYKAELYRILGVKGNYVPSIPSLYYLEKAVKLDPTYTDGHFSLASKYYALGEYKKSYETYSKLLELLKNDPNATYHLNQIIYINNRTAKALYNIKEYKKSFAYFKAMLELQPTDQPVYSMVASGIKKLAKKSPKANYEIKILDVCKKNNSDRRCSILIESFNDKKLLK